ncbi:O-antigen ligase family protein [Fredinandcohnia sp. FSL W7-1320]|uniref:O-antigen ligase family protein n=1 Tax=Fredinandcohnia sp. FSL W7-1320 TaxID=2954540 RepID=UPI0030FD9705
MKRTHKRKNLIAQIILSVIVSLVLGWYVVNIHSISSYKINVILVLVVAAGMVGLYIFKKYIINKSPLFIVLMYLLIMSSFVGAIVSIDLGPFSLFPYRVLFLFIAGISIIKIYLSKFSLTNDAFVKGILTFLLFWIVYAFISLLWVKDLTSGIKDIVFLLFGIGIIFIVVAYLVREKHYISFYYIWLLMAAFLLLIGLINHFLQIHLPVSRIYTASAYQKTIPTAVFTNENDYASFVTISVFLCLAFMNHYRRLVSVLAGLGFIGISLYIIMVTSSRANLLAVMISFAFWYLIIADKKTKISLLRLLVIAGPVVILIFFNRVLSILQKVIHEITSLNIGQASAEGGSVEIRVNLLKNVLVFLQETFGFGVGAGNAEYYMQHFQVFNTYGDFNIHNWWAEILVNYGLLIFTIYVLIYLCLIYKLYHVYKNALTKNIKMISEGLFMGLITFALASISPSSMMALPYNWLLFAFVIGFINFYQNYSHTKLEENDVGFKK